MNTLLCLLAHAWALLPLARAHKPFNVSGCFGPNVVTFTSLIHGIGLAMLAVKPGPPLTKLTSLAVDQQAITGHAVRHEIAGVA